MMNRHADNPGEKANPPRPLRSGDIESERKRRTREQILAVALGDREKIVAQLVGHGDLLQHLRVKLMLGLARIRKFSEQSNLHRENRLLKTRADDYPPLRL